MKKFIPFFLLSTLFIQSGCDAPQKKEKDEANAVASPLNSTEYKLMLNPEKFTDYESGFETWWEIIRDVADSEGITIEAADKPMEVKRREIHFFDTQNDDLRKSGFSLRQRIKYQDGKKKAEFELTLKYRRPTAAEALTADLSLSEGYVPKDEEIELESDVVYFPVETGTEKTIFSLANSTVLDAKPPMLLKELALIFPVLGELGLPAETNLIPVVDVPVDEWKVSPGEFDFGDGLKAEMDIAVWILETGSERIAIPEFSFDHDYRKDHSWDKGAMRKCTSFMKKLYDAHTDWVVPGSSKTKVLYDIKLAQQ